MNYKLALSVVLLALVLLFVIQNTDMVEITFLLWTISMSRALLIFVVLGIGVLVGWLVRGHFAQRANR